MSKSEKGSEKNYAGEERRRSKRIPVLNSFSLSLVVPGKGPYRLRVQDLSELGVGFFVDLDQEEPSFMKFTQGEELDLQIYINQSLAIPISGKIVRIDSVEKVRRIGVEFQGRSSPQSKAIAAFVKALDAIADAVSV